MDDGLPREEEKRVERESGEERNAIDEVGDGFADTPRCNISLFLGEGVCVVEAGIAEILDSGVGT